MSNLLGSPSLDFMYISASAPDAPPLSDTTIGCFIRLFFWMAACIIRAIWSDAPPALAAYEFRMRMQIQVANKCVSTVAGKRGPVKRPRCHTAPSHDQKIMRVEND